MDFRAVMKFKAISFLIGLTSMCAPASSVYNFSSAPLATDSSLSLGFEFSTNTAITVASLGYFDADGDGFASAHTVGIFDGAGHLVVSTTLAAGAGDPLDGQFRFKAITPITLVAGQTYTLAATTGGAADAWAYGDPGTTLADFIVDPRISIGQEAARFEYQGDDMLRDPCEHFRYMLYAGPTFEIAPTATPEPGSATLLGMAGLLAVTAFIAARRLAKSRI